MYRMVRAVLSEEQARNIGAELGNGGLTVKALADKYGVKASAIWRLKTDMRKGNTEGSEIVNLPTEEVAAAAAPAKYKSKKFKIAADAEGREVVQLAETPVSKGNKGSKKTQQKEKTQETQEVDLEILEIDEPGYIESFERMLRGEEEKEKLLEEAEQEEEVEEAPPVWHNEKFKEVKLSDKETLEALLGESGVEQVDNFVNEIVKPAPRIRSSRTGEVVEDEESLALRAKTIAKIHLNVSTFGDHLPWIKNKDKFLNDLPRKTTRELCDLCSLIETQRSLGNAANQLKHLFYLGAQGVEVATTSYLDMKTHGFSSELQQRDKELTLIFQEISIDSADTLRAYTTPHARLGMLFASTLFMVDNRNRMVEYKQKMEIRPTHPGIKEDYKDL